jgi:hypothetical protein
MSQQFDEFSKHMAQKRSRRSLFKFLGGGFVVAAFSAIGSSTTNAAPQFNQTNPSKGSSGFRSPIQNGYDPIESRRPRFNQMN